MDEANGALLVLFLLCFLIAAAVVATSNNARNYGCPAPWIDVSHRCHFRCGQFRGKISSEITAQMK